MRALFITLFSFCSLMLIGQVNNSKKIVGLWQNSAEYVSGWMDCYQFFPDQTFIFNYDKVNCMKNCSTYYYKGNWSVQNDSLVLSVYEKKILVGGTFVKMLEDDGVIRILTTGTDSVITQTKPEIIKLPLLLMLPNQNRECVKIDDVRYWLMDENPANY